MAASSSPSVFFPLQRAVTPKAVPGCDGARDHQPKRGSGEFLLKLGPAHRESIGVIPRLSLIRFTLFGSRFEEAAGLAVERDDRLHLFGAELEVEHREVL